MSAVRRKLTICLVLFVAVSLLGGCAGVDRYLPAEPPQLSVAEKILVGDRVAARLQQMIGGPYYDKQLSADLNRLAGAHALPGHKVKPFVVDRNSPAIYFLPGGRVILSRGLLADVESPQELARLVKYVAQTDKSPLSENSTRETVDAINEILAGADSVYDPESAAIRLARAFEQRSCESECLHAVVQQELESSGMTSLPESVTRLSTQQAGFALLAEARDLEMAGDQASAIALYLQAAATAVDEPRILGSLGLAYLRSGDLQSARLHLQKAVKLQPDYYRTRMGLGYLYLQTGKIRKANSELAESVRLLPLTENLFLLAEAREKGGDLESAKSLYRLIVETDRYSKLGKNSALRLKQMETSQ